MTLAGGLYGPAFATKHTQKQHIPLDKRYRDRINWAEEAMAQIAFETWLLFCKQYGAEFYDES